MNETNIPVKDEIVAMAAAVIAEELGVSVNRMRIVSFREIKKSALEQYIADNNIAYTKYVLPC